MRIRLIVPGPEVEVMRRTDMQKPGSWHIVKSKGKQKALCGVLLTYKREIGDSVEYSTLGEIQGGLCAVCWPFGWTWSTDNE